MKAVHVSFIVIIYILKILEHIGVINIHCIGEDIVLRTVSASNFCHVFQSKKTQEDEG